ncbi:hypothetical protein SUDANB2_00240 [Streptomyces sp. enrichment culture]
MKRPPSDGYHHGHELAVSAVASQRHGPSKQAADNTPGDGSPPDGSEGRALCEVPLQIDVPELVLRSDVP